MKAIVLQLLLLSQCSSKLSNQRNSQLTNLAQTSSNKFASIGSILEDEMDIEQSHELSADGAIDHLIEKNNQQKKDNQKYSSQQALKESLDSNSDLKQAIEEDKKEFKSQLSRDQGLIQLKFVDTDLEDDQLKRNIGQKNQKNMNHEKKQKHHHKEKEQPKESQSKKKKDRVGLMNRSPAQKDKLVNAQIDDDSNFIQQKLKDDNSFKIQTASFDSDKFLKSIESNTFMEPGKSISMADIVSTVNQQENKQEVKKEEFNDEITDWKDKPSFSSSGFRVELQNDDGAGYVGTIYLGSEEKPARVLFDTGSDYLAVTSDLCLDPKLGKQEQDDPVFNATSLSYELSGKDLRKCKSVAYSTKESASSKYLGGDDKNLDYGSAKLQGKLYQDKACLDQNRSACMNFEFLALYQAKGLDDIDGVLGLAVHPNSKNQGLNYVWTLKNKGYIDNAIVSFSIAGPNKDDKSYAIFGGINPEQIVGGLKGLHKMQTMAYRPYWTQSVKQWALEGKSIKYNNEECQKVGQEKSFAAIIDTGSSNLGVPPQVFKFLKQKWQNTIEDLDCTTDDNFCQVQKPCTEVAKNLSTFSIQIGNQMFEMTPLQYLNQAEGRCQFAIHENQLKGSSGNLMLIGDLLLRHLYQVYDFEHETISLGINKHSEGEILMYEVGNRPEDAPKIQLKVSEDAELPIDVKDRFNS